MPARRWMVEEKLTTGEVARLLDCSAAWVRKLGDQGVLEYVKTRLGRLYEREDAERLAHSRIEERKEAAM